MIESVGGEKIKRGRREESMIQDEKVWVRDKTEREIDRQRKRYIQR